MEKDSNKRPLVHGGLPVVGQCGSQNNRETEGAKNTRDRPICQRITKLAIGPHTIQTIKDEYKLTQEI